MKGLGTLLWLEYRRSRVWSAALVGSLLFWFWGMNQVRAIDLGEELGIRLVLLTMAWLVTAVVLAIMCGRFRGETRQGQYQVLLLSGPSGYVHILARFLYALGTALPFAVACGGLLAWAGRQAGLPLDTGSTLQAILVLPLWGAGVLVAPVLAWVLLLMTFVSAYRISGSGWIPGTVFVFGTGALFGPLLDWMTNISFSLPGWPLFGRLVDVLQNMNLDQEMPNPEWAFLLPQEPLWIMLALTVGMLVLAGRIWEEVEV